MFDAPAPTPERGIAAAGALASLAALFSSAACCVLPLLLAGAGVSASGLAAVVPWRVPLVVVSGAMLAAGWLFYFRRRQACAADPACAAAPPSRATFWVLSLATIFAGLSASWKLFEQPLMRALGG